MQDSKQTNEDSAHSAPQLIELPEMPPHGGQGPGIMTGALDAIEHVKVKLTVQVGEAHLTVGELRDMKEEQVVKLESLADAPVDILLEGRIVARGQLVAVDDNFGVRITELPKARS
ncbi:MAG: FliM/FliN family flagellar motor switch protein [Burkholderiaceae bacterium]|nr:FliM/FliN family flagellar motor switch protein [Burkholderiaceae bacterium]